MSPPWDPPETTRTFVASRRKWGLVLAVCLAFVAIGVVMLASDGSPAVAWGAMVFFGVCAVAATTQLIRPGRLVLGPRAFEVISPGHRQRWDHVSCSQFEVWHNPAARHRLVVFDADGDAGGLNSGMTGRSSALPDTYGMSAEALAGLLNEARTTAVGPAGPPRSNGA